MFLYLDIETLPFARDEDRILELARASVPGNYKKQEAIDEWIEANKEEVYRKTSLDWRYARILSIGYALDDAAPEVIYMQDPTDVALRFAFDRLHSVVRTYRQRPTWVAHNGGNFDVPMLYRNALRLRHPLASVVPWEKWGKGLDDTMEMWARTNPRDYTRIDDIAAFLGLPRKAAGLDGSKVYATWLAGEHDRIREYQAGDIVQLRDVHRTLRGEW
jgi:predicted PolB exonuclease-like 3'-5' exonuclease